MHKGTLYILGYDAHFERIRTESRSSSDVSTDAMLCSKALTFRDASRHDGRLFVCTLVPRWKRPLLRLLGIRYD